MATKNYAGKEVEVTEDGFLTNHEDWSKEIAAEIAKEEGIDALTDEHWKVIDFMRDDFKAKGAAPSIRRINKAGGVATKDMYRLFPDGPAKKAAKVSGLGKPQGCV